MKVYILTSVDSDGNPAKTGFKSKREAQKAWREAMAQQGVGELTPSVVVVEIPINAKGILYAINAL